jgi:hypothetical protein
MKSKITYTEQSVTDVFDKLCENNTELKHRFLNYLKQEYSNKNKRIYYVDITEISNYVIEKLAINETEKVSLIFIQAEEILNSCNEYIENIIVIGLFEGIQNTGKTNIYNGYNSFLKNTSKLKWGELIDSWEGIEWRKTEESQKILNKKQ